MGFHSFCSIFLYMRVYKQFHAEFFPEDFFSLHLCQQELWVRADSISSVTGQLVCIPFMWDMDGLPSSTENLLLPPSFEPGMKVRCRYEIQMFWVCDEAFHRCFYTLGAIKRTQPSGRSHHTLTYSLLTTRATDGALLLIKCVCLHLCVCVGYVCCCPALGVRVSHRGSWQQVHPTHSHTQRESRWHPLQTPKRNSPPGVSC